MRRRLSLRLHPPALAQRLVAVLSIAAAGCDSASPREAPREAQQRAPLSWTAASTPLKLRRRHTATLLPDGRVLVAGGEVASAPSVTAELYDPRTAAFVEAADMSAPRALHTATLLADGRVLVTGGQGEAGQRLDTAELFEPRGGTFLPAGALTGPRVGHTATLLATGEVLIAGGRDDATAEIWDPGTGTFVPTGRMSRAHSGHSATLLSSGKVLLVGLTSAELYDPASRTFTPAAPLPGPLTPSKHSATLLRDGRVFIVGGGPCGSTGGPLSCETQTLIFDPLQNGGTGGFYAGLSLPPPGRILHSTTLLPSGELLIAGGASTGTGTLFYDPQLDRLTAGEAMAAAHWEHTATLLPSGDVLVVGGTQASAELFTARGSGSPGRFTEAGRMRLGVGRPGTTLLADGRLLLAGGDTGFQTEAAPSGAAQLYDRATQLFIDLPRMSSPRVRHTMTLLRDGRVLIAGGKGDTALATAELFDPTADGGRGVFRPTGSMRAPRMSHSATLLPTGRVLVAGGHNDEGALSSAEFYDPDTGAFLPAPSMTIARSDPSTVLLPTGAVLVVSGGTAELFVTAENRFVSTGSPGGSHDFGTLTLLATGKVLLFGGDTLAGEIYDPDTGTFRFTSPATAARWDHRAVLLPSGKVLLLGGWDRSYVGLELASAELFDPLGDEGRGSFIRVSDMLGGPRVAPAAALLPSGEVLVAGGRRCFSSGCVSGPLTLAELFAEPVGDEAAKPVLTRAPARVTPGEMVAIEGAGLLGLGSSSGRASASLTNFPIAVWEPVGGSAVIGGLTDFSATSARWKVPSTALHGLGWLRVITDGIASATALPVEIAAAPLAAACERGAACESGFCADGVCCDRACDGACEGCSAERKGTGSDGACGPVPPERDPDDACELSAGAPCTSSGQCTTGHCVDGVCCDSLCAGQCEACDAEGSVGLCVPVSGAPHGDRAACAGAVDPCEALRCDGRQRDACAAKIGPCTPYACGASGCETSCEDSDDCAVGYHCDAEGGQCSPGLCDGTLATAADGTKLDCSPYRCQADGSCRTACGKAADCADGFVCDLAGQCITRPAADEVGGCQCAAAGGGRPARGLVASAALALAALAFRRRLVSSRAGYGARRATGAVGVVWRKQRRNDRGTAPLLEGSRRSCAATSRPRRTRLSRWKRCAPSSPRRASPGSGSSR